MNSVLWGEVWNSDKNNALHRGIYTITTDVGIV